MIDTLLPCPSCHGDDLAIAQSIAVKPGNETWRTQHWIQCTDCDMAGPILASEETARAAWNAMPRGKK